MHTVGRLIIQAMHLCCAAQGCLFHHQSCNPLDPRGKAEAWLTKDILVKNCGSGNEEDEPQLGHHPEAGQWQTGVEELRCCLIRQLAWWVVMMMMTYIIAGSIYKKIHWLPSLGLCILYGKCLYVRTSFGYHHPVPSSQQCGDTS